MKLSRQHFHTGRARWFVVCAAAISISVVTAGLLFGI